MSETCDILVIGLGPAGASAAEAAAQTGAHVIAIERKAKAGYPVQCAEFVPALIGMEVSNLAGTIVQHIDSMVTFVEDESADLTPDFPGRMIDRAAFDAALAEEARKAGAGTRFGTGVRSVHNDGSVILGDGQTIRPRILIGADGPRSLVGEAIGSVNEAIVETRQLTTDLHGPHEATDIWLSGDIPGGYAWLFPKGEQANIGLGVEARYRQQLKPALDELHNRLIEEGRVSERVHGWTGGAIPVGGLLKAIGQLGETQVLLAGDAAGLTHPITGAGISSAVISGRMAGEAAGNMLSGEAGAAGDYQDDLTDLFAPALTRACAHRKRLMTELEEQGTLAPDALRSGWIAYKQYWNSDAVLPA